MPEHNYNTEDSRQNPGHRITIKGARRMLGMIGKNYDDDEIAEILEVLYGIAEEGFQIYARENGASDHSPE